MSAEGHYAGWTANAHTRGPVLSLVTNWSEVLRQSIKLKVNMGHHGPKQLVNFLCPKNPVSSQALVVLPAPQTPTKGKKMQKVWRFWAWLCAREVAANPSSVAPVEPDVAAGKDQIFFFFVESFRVVPDSFGEHGEQWCFSKKHPASFFVEHVQVEFDGYWFVGSFLLLGSFLVFHTIRQVGFKGWERPQQEDTCCVVSLVRWRFIGSVLSIFLLGLLGRKTESCNIDHMDQLHDLQSWMHMCVKNCSSRYGIFFMRRGGWSQMCQLE